MQPVNRTHHAILALTREGEEVLPIETNPAATRSPDGATYLTIKLQRHSVTPVPGRPAAISTLSIAARHPLCSR